MWISVLGQCARIHFSHKLKYSIRRIQTCVVNHGNHPLGIYSPALNSWSHKGLFIDHRQVKVCPLQVLHQQLPLSMEATKQNVL